MLVGFLVAWAPCWLSKVIRHHVSWCHVHSLVNPLFQGACLPHHPDAKVWKIIQNVPKNFAVSVVGCDRRDRRL